MDENTRVRSIHVPGGSQNPYQRLLTTALTAVGAPSDIVRTCDAAEQIRRSEADHKVLHIHWLPRGYRGIGNLLEFLQFRRMVRSARRAGARVYWTAHNLYSHESRNRRREQWLTRFVITQADGIIVHSPAAETMLRNEFTIAGNQSIRPIPHGNYIGCYSDQITTAEARLRLGIKPDEIAFVFLGNIRPYKGVPELLTGFRELVDQRARLVIAGAPQDEMTRACIESQARNDRRVVLRLGFVPDIDIQIYMRAADVVVLPYLNVLTSGAAVLAMSFGLPCVAPLSGCLPDYLSQQPQLLYSLDKPSGLEQAMATALTLRTDLPRLGELNLRVARKADWQFVAEQTLEYYLSPRKHLLPNAPAGAAAKSSSWNMPVLPSSPLA
jgi:beta-1,4-mannosyltransferase